MTTPAHDDIARALRARKTALQAEIDAAQARGREARDDTSATDVHDAKDDAEHAQALTTADAERERDEAELRRIDEALARLDAGSYGTCVACGEPIAPARLQAEPATTRCLACQTAFESRRG